MFENKLLNILNLLTGVEKREFAHFLQSPYFNRREDVIRLWEQLLKPPGASPDPAKAIYARVYPGRPYDDAQWRHLQSFLLLRVENFLAQRASERVPLLADLHLAPVYRQKKAEKPLDHLLRRATDRLEKMPRDHEYYYLQYRLEWEKYAAVESRTRTRENNLAAVARALDTYYISSKLRLACLMESHSAVFQIEYDVAFLPDLLRFVENGDLRDIPVIALYFYCYKALTSGAEADFRAFRRELESRGAGLPAGERRTFLLLAVNYCIKRLNTGEQGYIREAFDLYRLGLDTEVLIEDGVLSRFAYKNIVALGLRREESDWVEAFIFRYEPFLEEKYRAANRDYNLARLYYSKKDFGKAMPLLARVDESDLLLNLDSRVMLLKMYYETGEWDALDALIASFRILLLRKKKIIGYHSSHYLNMLRYIRKLVRLNPNDKAAVASFRSEVEGNRSVIEKEWLLKTAAGI